MAPVTGLVKLIAVSAFSIILVACGEASSTTSTAAPPAPSVNVAEVLVEQITETDIYTGRLQAPQTVMVVPRVSGYIEQVLFEEGSLVNKGDVLLKIDSRIFAAEVERLEAELNSAKSSLRLAQKGYTRSQTLSNENAISAELLDSRLSAQEKGAAAVASTEAALLRARLDLEFSEVRAPITGRVSSALITEGNYVNLGSSLLTRIVSTEHMHAYFDVDEKSFLKYQDLNSVLPMTGPNASVAAVQMALADENDFRHLGHIDFVDNTLAGDTGTIRLRAIFNNLSGELLPGMFARLRIAGSSSYQAVLIDDRAVGTDLSNKFVLVVDENDQVQYRSVVLGEKINGLRIVSEGLSGADRIIIEGIQRVRPSMQVTPVMIEMSSEETIAQLRQSQQRLERQLSQNALQTVQKG